VGETEGYRGKDLRRSEFRDKNGRPHERMEDPVWNVCLNC